MKVRAYTRKGLKAEGIAIQIFSVLAGLWELLFYFSDRSVFRLILVVMAICLFIAGGKCRKIARESKTDTIYMNGWKV